MIRADLRDIQRLEADLDTFAKEAFPYATRSTVNTAAFRARRHAHEIVKERMVLRNRYTLRTIQVNKTRSLNVDSQAAAVGSTEDYMALQEDGGVITSKGKHGVPIPTSYAAGQGKNRRPRTRLPTRRRRLANIRLGDESVKPPHGMRAWASTKQETFVRVKMAIEQGYRFVFLQSEGGMGGAPGTKAIYEVSGRGDRIRMNMVWDLSQRTVHVGETPWLEPAVRQTEREVIDIYFEALRFQLERRNLFVP